MKLLKKFLGLVVVFSILMVMPAMANELTWENAPGHHNQSVLLPSSETSARDIVKTYARGDILSMGIVEITNEQNGSIFVRISTYAHNNVDKIRHTLLLDQWDDKSQTWKQVDSWEFEKTKEESANGKISELSTGFTLTGYQTNKYYRVRGLHSVQLGDDTEACASETNGVLITDGPT